MADPTAKIIGVDTAVIEETLDKDAEATVNVEVEVDGAKYKRQITFVIHAQQKYHINGPLTEDFVKRAIVAEAARIKSIRDTLTSFKSPEKQNVDLVAESKK